VLVVVLVLGESECFTIGLTEQRGLCRQRTPTLSPSSSESGGLTIIRSSVALYLNRRQWPFTGCVSICSTAPDRHEGSPGRRHRPCHKGGRHPGRRKAVGYFAATFRGSGGRQTQAGTVVLIESRARMPRRLPEVLKAAKSICGVPLVKRLCFNTSSPLSHYASIRSSSRREGPGGITASWVPATSKIPSTIPGRAMISCGRAATSTRRWLERGRRRTSSRRAAHWRCAHARPSVAVRADPPSTR
jgi:hypothetical protein